MNKKWGILLLLIGLGFTSLYLIFSSNHKPAPTKTYGMKLGIERTYKKQKAFRVQRKIKSNFNREKVVLLDKKEKSDLKNEKTKKNKVGKKAKAKKLVKNKKKKDDKKKKQAKKKKDKAEKSDKTEELAETPEFENNKNPENDTASNFVAGNLEEEESEEDTPKKEIKENSRKLADWMQYVLVNPSTEKLNEFIDAFNKNQISANWYYTIIDKMLNSGNEILKDHAIVALSAAPTLQSFFVLSEIANDSTYSNKHQQMAKDAIDVSYSSLAQVDILNQSLQSDEDIVVLQAAILVKTSAEKNLVFNNRNRNQNANIILKFQSIHSVLLEILNSDLSQATKAEVRAAQLYLDQRLSQAEKDFTLGFI